MCEADRMHQLNALEYLPYQETRSIFRKWTFETNEPPQVSQTEIFHRDEDGGLVFEPSVTLHDEALVLEMLSAHSHS